MQKREDQWERDLVHHRWLRAAMVVVGVAVLMPLVSCSSASRKEHTDKTPLQAWRLDEELSSPVQYHLQHIVIADRDSQDLEGRRMPLSGWAPEARTRYDAWKRAIELRAELLSNPERFADLARQYSDDASTRSMGGALGHVRGGELQDRYHDIAYVLSPGEISGVFETKAGLHILKRLPLQKAHWVPAHAIALSYQGSLLRGPSRTRAEALALGHRVAETLRKAPETLPALAKQHSDLLEHQDGDIGALSTHRSPWLGTVAEALMRARAGEVVGPFVTPLGVYVAVRPSEELSLEVAATSVLLPTGNDAVSSQVRAMLASPTLTTELTKQIRDVCPSCTVKRQRWFGGQAGTQMRDLVAKTPMGAIREADFGVSGKVFLIRRELPAEVHQSLGLDWSEKEPVLAFRDAASLIQRLSSQDLAYFIERFAGDFRRVTGVPDAARQTILEGIAEMQGALAKEQEPARRLKAFGQLHARLAIELDPKQYSEYRTFEASWTRRAQLVSR